MRMSMVPIPMQIMGMACTVCGYCSTAGTTHAYDKTITDVSDFISGNPPERPVPRCCPKCGIACNPTWHVVEINGKYYARPIESKKKHRSVSVVLTIWEAKETAKQMNRVNK